ncbi:MAG TPA: hypothetical protein VM533_18435 [Fimbriiglobus sp.]|jgi:hypothetical protein|nr:hypothetical protein [Fimbriiglobus sp.]
MSPRRTAPLALVLLLLAARPILAGERYSTDNFVVDAPTKELAQKFGEFAEHYRKEKALDWLGYEMPRWPQKCPLRVQVTLQRTGGATTFTFGAGPDRRSGVMSQEMHIFGETKQLLNSVLPHEVTHTVLAHHFGQAVPRWADEGGSVLSENDEERYTHDVKCREVLNQGRGIPLRVLFSLKEYPRDMHVLYAQGYSVSQYLIDKGGPDGKKKFLQFVEAGMRNDNRNWEEAVQMYGFSSTDELQVAWIDALRTPPARIAARNQDRKPTGDRGDGRSVASLTGGRGVETRTSAVPGLPLLEAPVVARGTAPEREPASKPDPTPKPPIPRLLPPEPPTKR